MGPRYRSLSGSLIDPEKRRDSIDDSDDSPSYISSRETSASYSPMLGNGGPRPATFAYHLPRRRFSRYFTLILFSIVALFIFYLVHASWASNAALQSGAHIDSRPPEPRPWEGFPFLQRYVGGIRTLVPRGQNQPEYPSDEDVEVQRLQDAAMAAKEQADKVTSKEKGFDRRRQNTQPLRRSEKGFPIGQRFDPYPSYAAGGERATFEAPVPCYLNNDTRSAVPKLWVYPGVTKGFPDPVMGSYEIFGLQNDVCFERYGRLGPYGYGYSRKFGGSGAGIEGEKEGAEDVWGGEVELDYRQVKWAKAQEQCLHDNAHRFKPSTENGLNHFFSSMGSGGPRLDAALEQDASDNINTTTANGKQFLNRTAIIIRTWSDYQYDDEDIFYLRSLVNELSIQSGGEYTIHFLIHVKDSNLQIWADDATYQRVLDDSLPEEFRGMGTLWSERQMGLIYAGVDESLYRDLPVHGAYRSTYMPVQYFAHMHPEYDFFWHWEMDIRYTGHFYHLFHQVSQWAKKQPRKGLWERNGRFYVPSEHGSWEDFRQMVRVQTEHGTANQQNIYAKLSADAGKKHPLDSESRRPETPVWGPMPPTGEDDSTVDPENDPQPPTSYDKDNYEWGVGEEADFITFNPLFDPHTTNWILAEDVSGYDTRAGYPPRRTAIITASRLSRRLLETMHRETTLKRHTMFSEMWPGSCALHHGYKAVYAPHPVYIDRAWPTSYLAAIFNNGRNGAAGGARTSVFSDERQHNFLGTTWYYHAGFSPNLWRRWMGFKVDNDGGEQWEIANEGRMCVPAMLLHPVKQVDLVYEHQDDEKQEVQQEEG